MILLIDLIPRVLGVSHLRWRSVVASNSLPCLVLGEIRAWIRRRMSLCGRLGDVGCKSSITIDWSECDMQKSKVFMRGIFRFKKGFQFGESRSFRHNYVT